MDLQRAIHCFGTAADLLPTSVAAWNDLAVVLHQIGRVAEAHGAVQNALFADPGDEDALANREQIVGRPAGAGAV